MQRLPGQDSSQFKVPLVGDTSVGKTSILGSYTQSSSPDNSTPTVGVSTVPIELESNGKKIELTIWDTAGQEKFRSLVPLYTRHSSLIIIVFDLSLPNSIESINHWLNKVRSEVESYVPIFLCGNKNDLPLAFSKSELETFAQSQNCRLFYTSAITGEGIADMFQAAADLLTSNVSPFVQESQNISEDRATANQKKCC